MSSTAFRKVFFEPTWREDPTGAGQLSHDSTRRRRGAGESVQTRAAPPNIGSLAAQLLGPQGFAGERLAQAEERLRTRRSWSPPQDFRAFHWHQRPTPPRPPPELSRTVRPRDIVGWANARAARAAHAGCQGDWRAAFRGYIVASQLLQLVLESDEPTQELRDETRRQMAELRAQRRQRA